MAAREFTEEELVKMNEDDVHLLEHHLRLRNLASSLSISI